MLHETEQTYQSPTMSTVTLRSLLSLAAALLSLSVVVPPSRAQTCTANIPHIEGDWRTLPYRMPVNPISATLLHIGQVLIVAGSENDAHNNSEGAESYRNAIWDPKGTSQNSITVQDIDYDVFCSGTAVLPDGRALVVGGTSDYSFKGDNRASIFDPATRRFVQSQRMVDGRWYATATTLGDGRVMTFSGLNETTGGINNTVEIYDLKNADAGWTSLVAAPFTPSLYPYMLLLPNGKVFYTGQGDRRSTSAWIFDPDPMQMKWTASVATTSDRHFGSAVLLPLLPPTHTPKVMNFGGGNPATNTTEIIDLSAAPPNWTRGPDMSTGRIQMNAVILPNGKVLAEGGSVNNDSPNLAGKHADVYDPVSNTFSSGGTASYSRLYHSVALLLPDATVMSMGSNPELRGSYEPAIEIYTPAYLFDANDRLITTNRPSITGVPPGVLGYNAPFSVTYTSTSAISSAVLVRPGSTTHTFDMDQRLIGLCGPSPQPPCNGSGTLTLTSPPNGNIAPPGYYMLFLLDSAGVPSEAKFIQLSPYATSPPTSTITSPALDTTITAGGAVFFSTDSTFKRSWVFPGGSPATSTAQTPGKYIFNTPGIYVTSLTVIDGAGNSDPSPPTRTITVLPTSADFSIAVSPSSKAVTPGQSTTFTVTITPLTGFNGTVSLSVSSESGFPNGVTSSGFSPSSITGSGSSTITMNTTTSVNPCALSLTIKGTAGALTHTASTTLLVNLAVPTSLTATPGNAQVALSWPASVGATSYRVKRATVSGGPYVTVACATQNNYTDTGLSSGTTYYYVVSVVYTAGPNAGGESADSSEASATTQSSAPPSPTGLTATPGNGQVVLSWNASSGATSYKVKRATVSGGPYTTIATPSTTTYTNSGLTNGTTYYYVVSAVNAVGESANSSQVSATPYSAQSIPLEAGRVSGVTGQWTSVSVTQAFTTPIVTAGPLSSADVQPAGVRVRNVSGSGFQVRAQEWDSQDGVHGAEQLSYVVMERGRYLLGNGKVVLADSTSVSGGGFQSKTFSQPFPTIPLILATVVTQNEADAVTVQIRNVTPTGFQIRLWEQEANSQAHAAETVHYLAWEPGAGTLNGFAFEVSSKSADHKFTPFPFTSSFPSPPLFFAGSQTSAGAEAYSLRYQGLGTGSVQVRLQEDDSFDAEFFHVLETVGYLALSAGNGNQAPNGVMDTPTGNVAITAGQSVTFAGSGSDPDNNLPVTYQWDFGASGVPSSTAEDPGAKVFNTPGTFTITFTVTDSLGLADPTPVTREITVNATANQAPNGVMDTPTGNVAITAGQSVTFAGSGSDPNNNLPVTYQWDFGASGVPSSTAEDPGAKVFNTPGTFTITFTVTDSLGLADPTPATRVITVNAAAGLIPLEAGRVSGVTGQWTSVSVTQAFTTPIVTAGPLSSADVQPAGVRVRNVSGSGFQVRAQEWDSQDGVHGAEQLSYVVMERGRHLLGNGKVVLADSTSVGGGGFQSKTFSQPFPTIPLILATVVTQNEADAVTVQIRNVTPTGFQIRLWEQEANSQAHAAETVHYLAWEPGAGTLNGFAFEVSSKSADHKFTPFPFTSSFPSPPLFFAGSQTSAGAEAYSLRYQGLGTGSVQVRLQEDDSFDAEFFHVLETVGYLALSAGNGNQAPNGVIDTPTGNVAITAGQSVTFAGSGSDPDNNLPVTYQWDFGASGVPSSTAEDPGAKVW